jgi:hypothetical protein
MAAAPAIVRDPAEEAKASFELDGVSFAPRNKHTHLRAPTFRRDKAAV